MFRFSSQFLKLWICLFCISVTVSAQSEQEVEIIDFFAKVYLAPNEKSKFVGLAQKGERYPVIDRHDTWVRIRFKNAIGWIYSSQVGPVGTVAARAAEQAIKDSIKAAEAQKVIPDTVATVQPQPTVSPSTPVEVPQTPAETPQRSITRSVSRSEPGESSTYQEPKEEEKPRNWFTKKSQPQLPSLNQDLTDTSKLYFRVTFGPARVLSYLDPEAPILGMARKGDFLPLIGEGDSWCKVEFRDTIGWIEHRHGKVTENTTTFDFNSLLPLIVIIAILIFIVLVITIIIRLKQKKGSGSFNQCQKKCPYYCKDIQNTSIYPHGFSGIS